MARIGFAKLGTENGMLGVVWIHACSRCCCGCGCGWNHDGIVNAKVSMSRQTDKTRCRGGKGDPTMHVLEQGCRRFLGSSGWGRIGRAVMNVAKPTDNPSVVVIQVVVVRTTGRGPSGRVRNSILVAIFQNCQVHDRLCLFAGIVPIVDQGSVHAGMLETHCIGLILGLQGDQAFGPGS